MQVDHEEGGLVLEIINLPEAMKLHTENVFEGEYIRANFVEIIKHDEMPMDRKCTLI